MIGESTTSIPMNGSVGGGGVKYTTAVPPPDPVADWGAGRIPGLSATEQVGGTGTWMSPDFNQPMKLVDDRTIPVPVPDGFAHEEELKRLAQLVAALLASGMPERELARRLARYHPMAEG